MSGEEKKSRCTATCEMIEIMNEGGVNTAFQRAEDLKACAVGAAGDCCKLCAMGPCRVPKTRTKVKEEERFGVCGATSDTISARNFLRMIAAGASAHSDHGRDVAQIFCKTARGEVEGYSIKDVEKLLNLAKELEIETANRETNEIAVEVGELLLGEFGKQEGEILLARRAPEKRQKIWRELGIIPRGVDREIVESLHRTHMGNDQDYENILNHGMKTSLGDGWGGSMIATELQDILFRTPLPVRGEVNLGVLREKEVNVIVHGHDPLLSEMIVQVARDPEMKAFAKEHGAEGINVAGICCTANEVLMRHGVPIAGNFLQQEAAISTGAVEAMVVDIQCIMQSLASVAGCFHTKLITTTPKARIRGAVHIGFDEEHPVESAKKIVRTAVENFSARKGKPRIPAVKTEFIAGFSHETINYQLGGAFRASYRPLNDNIINGRIRGVCGVVGCNNPRAMHEGPTLDLVKELISKDVLVLQTGCAAIASAKAGLMVPEAAAEHAGEGLAEVCETVGLPPVIHMGSCVDNSRILVAASEMVREGGLGEDLSDLPAAGAAPEWMSEKAVAIGQYFVASGVFTVFGTAWPTTGSEKVSSYLFEKMEELVGGKWAFEPDAAKSAALIIEHIDKKRKALKIDKARERVLFDMDKRREMEV